LNDDNLVVDYCPYPDSLNNFEQGATFIWNVTYEIVKIPEGICVLNDEYLLDSCLLKDGNICQLCKEGKYPIQY